MVKKTGKEVEKAIKPVPVEIIENLKDDETIVEMPDYAGDMLEATSLVPMAVFNEATPVGAFIEGVYRGAKHEVGANKSTIHMIDVDGKGRIVGVWESTALQNKMMILAPKHGDFILIVYTGLVPTKRGQSPCKTFRVFKKEEKK